ncbi:ribosomal protein L1p/L10e family-domain-containing protein [Massariosphaeria phaeospora]|uniref:Ribosomal protein L1p/L10e family-domain-containing protein n=1 Tax=Massariosphaeria phaeospora TaxID=100035 RepID=A0A7C8I4K4_9PLEO|nr:ribosomal protein L1p/L10e family-domain-containing protein [Massariosphaeria phaeospora]
MANSKAPTKSVVKTDAAPEKSLTTKASHGSPYQLDPAQVERAATALVSHMKKHAETKEEEAKTKNLAADGDEPDTEDQPIFLNVTTKKHIQDSNKLRPDKITLPHPIQGTEVRICIFTKDPQRAYKDLVAHDAFPEALRAKVGRVLGVDKLKKRYKAYEQKRQLLGEYDLFMVDDRVTKVVADFLGKVFYKGKSKRPIPIRLTAGARVEKDKKPEKVVGTPQGVAREIESALNATYISMSESANTSIKIGKLSMTPQQLKENTEAVVAKVAEKFVPQGWRGIRSLHIKGPSTKALPIWLADELWTDETQVLSQPWKPTITDGGKSSDKKRKWEEWEDELLDDDEAAERRAALKPKQKQKQKAKKEPGDKEQGLISREKRRKMKREALESVQTPLIAG